MISGSPTPSATRSPHRAAVLLLGLLLLGFGPLEGQNGDRPGHVMTEVWRSMEVPEAPVLSPTDALSGLRVAPGFRVELVAAEPLVEDPVAIAWDPRGRLFVVEMRGFMPDVDGKGEDQPVGRVVLLDDEDRDGVMDRGTVFLDGLVMPRAVAVTSRGVLVAEPPHLWLCRDTTGDDRCDQKTDIGRYADPNLDLVEHTENGLLWALDNWIYSAKSDRRLRFVDGEIVEESPTVFRGQWGISQDDDGRLYFNTNSRWLYGDTAPVEYHYRNTNDRPKRFPGASERLVSSEEVYSIRVNPGINRGYQPDMLLDDGRLAKTTSVSGLCVYRGHQFDPKYSGDIFVPEPAGNVVGFFGVERGAAGIETEHRTYPDPQWGTRDFLASPDERFRPVDCAIGPDGALTVIDMYRGIIQHRQYVTTFLRKQILERELDRPLGLGRIYRIVEEERPIDHSRPRLETVEEQIAALSHPNGWHRDTAQRLLVEARPPAAIEPLRQLARSGSEPRARLHALWALHGIARDQPGALDLSTVRAALRSGQAGAPALLEAALRALPVLSPADRVELEGTVLDLASSSDAKTALLATYALGDLATAGARKSLTQTLLADQPELVRAAVTGLGGAEMDTLTNLIQRKRCRASSPCTDALARLAQAVLRSGDSRLAHKLLDVLLPAGAPADAEWQQALLLEALSVTTEDDWAPLPPAPDAWNQRLAAIGGSLEERAADLFEQEEAAPAFDVALARRTYRSCSSCHGSSGDGTSLAPKLAGARYVNGPAEALVRLILDGLEGPLDSGGEHWDDIMPGFRLDTRFTDDAVAALASYLRSSWGNEAEPVTAETVRSVREATRERSTPWSTEELEP